MGNDNEGKPRDIECTHELRPFERNRYFYGKLLTVRDFEAEQRYLIEKQRLVNRLIHGSGVVCGLKVEMIDATTLRIQPGVAIDCCGRDIVVPRNHDEDLSGETFDFGDDGKATVYILLKYDWCGKEMVVNVSDVSSCEESCCYSRIMESYKVETVEQMPEDCLPSLEGICDAWSNLSKVSEKKGPFKFERIMPKLLKKGGIFKVTVKATPTEDIASVKFTDTLPSNLELYNGSLSLEKENVKKGETISHTYWVRSKPRTGTSSVSGKVEWFEEMGEPGKEVSLPESEFDISETPAKEMANQFVEYWIKECPGYPEDPAVVLAACALQRKNGSFEIIKVDNAIVDEEGFKKRLVFSNPQLYELIKCSQGVQPGVTTDFPSITEINWEHNREYLMDSMVHSGMAQGATAGTITLADDASSTDDKYNGMLITIGEGAGIGQSRTITAYNGTSKVATVDSHWETIPDNTSFYRISLDESGEMMEKMERLEMSFDRAMDKATVTPKTLQVMMTEYGTGVIGDFPNIEAVITKADLPVYFYPETPEDEVHFRVLNNPFLTYERNLRKTVLANTINRVAATVSSSVAAQQHAIWEWQGYRVVIQLKGDFVLDQEGNPLDGDHLKGQFPTGNGAAGGLFESWMDLKIRATYLFDMGNLAKDYVNANPGAGLQKIAAATRSSEEITKLMADALAGRNVLYFKEGKYFPLPNPAKTMIVYDGKYAYMKESAEKLQADLSDKGIAAELKSSDELTNKEMNSYEIILLRAGTVQPTTGTKMKAVKSKVNWSRSTGKTEIVKSPFVENTNVYVIGGKNRDAVGEAIDNYVKNYRAVK